MCSKWIFSCSQIPWCFIPNEIYKLTSLINDDGVTRRCDWVSPSFNPSAGVFTSLWDTENSINVKFYGLIFRWGMSPEVIMKVCRILHRTVQCHTAPCWYDVPVCCQIGFDFKFCKLEKTWCESSLKPFTDVSSELNWTPVKTLDHMSESSLI